MFSVQYAIRIIKSRQGLQWRTQKRMKFTYGSYRIRTDKICTTNCKRKGNKCSILGAIIQFMILKIKIETRYRE